MNKNIVRVLIISLFFIMLHNLDIFALYNTETVRIGLEYKYKNVQSIPIATNEINLGYEQNNYYNSEVNLKSQYGFSVRATNSYYVSIGEVYTSYEQAFNRAANITGINAVVASLDSSTWTIYCGGYNSFNEANSMLSSISSNAQVVAPNNKMCELLDGTNVIIICDNSKSYPQISASNSNYITLSDRSYRGRIEFNRTLGQLTAVNVIDIEDYLCGVVPSEMPSSWNIEAIKAQTVAARTYTSKNHKHSDQGYDLCDSIHCQVYLGYDNENNISNQAVKETAGQKIYYNNELIDATYFSSSGGYTDDSENVWNNSIPYLRGVPDTNETEYKLWTRTLTTNDLNSFLNKSGINIGNAVSMRIDSTTQGGRVKSLTIVGTNGTKTLEKEDIKTFFNPSLDSNMFEILSGNAIIGDTISVEGSNSKSIQSVENINVRGDSTIVNKIGLNSSMYVVGANTQSIYSMKTQISNSDSFILSGKGSGHGVGMSQFGAKGMAETGATYIDILKHYYTSVEIK